MKTLTVSRPKKRSPAKRAARKAGAGDNAQKVFRNFLRLLEKAHAKALNENPGELQPQAREPR